VYKEPLLELAIYSYSEREYLDRCERYVQAHLPLRLRGGAGGPGSSGFEAAVRERLIDRFGGTWDYNQAVGWLRLYVLGNQLRGTYWFTTAKRIRTNPLRKRFEWHGSPLEVGVSDTQQSDEIFEELLSEVRRFSQEDHIKPRYVDLRPLLLLGPFIDWRALVDASIDAGLKGLHANAGATR